MRDKNEFKVNDYLTVKLGKSEIYVFDIKFSNCFKKY